MRKVCSDTSNYAIVTCHKTEKRSVFLIPQDFFQDRKHPRAPSGESFRSNALFLTFATANFEQ